MYTMKIENAAGEIFELTHDLSNYCVIGVSGLTTPTVNINTASAGLSDGAFFNSARVDMRNIVIDIVINGDIEANRKRLYTIFSIKRPCTVYFKNANRSVKIIGYVEVIDCDLFTSRQQAQISIICPKPFWEDLQVLYVELSHIMRRFSFPFSISANDPVPMSSTEEIPVAELYNPGDVECGVNIMLYFKSAVAVPTVRNSTTGEYISINYQFFGGGVIQICTVSGQLSAKFITSSSETDMTGYITQGSSWIKLAPGINVLTISAANNLQYMTAQITANALYGGV